MTGGTVRKAIRRMPSFAVPDWVFTWDVLKVCVYKML